MIFTLPLVVAIGIAIIAFFLILQPQTLSKTSLEDKIMRNQFKSSKHKWQKSQQKSFYFCYLCNKLTNGLFSQILQCNKCGIIIHKICRFTKLRKPDCKYLVAKNNATKIYHQWRQCSYITNTNCSVCSQICNGIQNYLCLWCGRIRHSSCSGQKIQCDFGPLRKFILQPTQIKCNSVNFTTNAFRSLNRIKKQLKQKTSESQDNQQQQQQKITINCHPSKTIVVVLINKKSGGQIGNNFIKAFYRILNPLQVISILDQGLQKLRIFTEVENLFLIVAGGDGTICSVLNYIKTIPKWADNNPPIAIIPLGTGNDLSRALGWGGSIEQQVNPSQMLLQYANAGKNQLLDRWKMSIRGQQHRQFTLYNYLGVGLDAKICMDFHHLRQKYPQLFFSQFSNKLIYTQIGTIDMFMKKNKNLRLSQLFILKIDGKQIDIQHYQNIIFLNINNWGGGVTGLWKPDAQKGFVRDSFGDGIMQVIGLTDVCQMAQVQVGMDQAFQVGQGKKIQMISKVDNKTIQLQIDGQPMQIITPFEITIQRKDQVHILATTPTDNGKIIHFLKQAIRQKIINEQQYNELVLLTKKIPF